MRKSHVPAPTFRSLHETAKHSLLYFAGKMLMPQYDTLVVNMRAGDAARCTSHVYRTQLLLSRLPQPIFKPGPPSGHMTLSKCIG